MSCRFRTTICGALHCCQAAPVEIDRKNPVCPYCEYFGSAKLTRQHHHILITSSRRKYSSTAFSQLITFISRVPRRD
ncbi:hypothetical protein WJX79_010484 [Trebouxia sp. C0005]